MKNTQGFSIATHREKNFITLFSEFRTGIYMFVTGSAPGCRDEGKTKKEDKMKKLIWESQEYQAEIYNNCTVQVYDTDKDYLLIEVDGTCWVGNTGGFRRYKHRLLKSCEGGKKLLALIGDVDDDGDVDDTAIWDCVNDVTR